VNDFLKGKTLYIADGHHRFQTAVTYRDNQRRRLPNAGEQPYDWVLMGFVALEDAGLEIYPTHRLVAKPEGFTEKDFVEAVAPWFEVQFVGRDLPEALDAAPGACVDRRCDPRRRQLCADAEGHRSHGAAWRGSRAGMARPGCRGAAPWRAGEAARLPEGAEFAYEKQASKAVAGRRLGKAGLAFLLRATRREQICACAEAGEPMPQKSTYFFPKLPSGAAINAIG
jgi:hypothetical protein